MTPKKLTLLSVAVLAALVVAGCGGSSYGGSGGSATKAASTSHAGTTVTVASNKLGKILVGPNGRTLYLFQKDTGPKSTCTGACLNAWPPLTASGKPTAGNGVTAAQLGTSALANGKTIVTYNNHPLYYYAGDTKAAQTSGQGLDQFGAEWYVLGPNGNKVEGAAKDQGQGSGDSSTPSSPPSPY